MYKIIRLSKANIKRHKKESFLLGLLVMMCAILFASSLSSFSVIKKIIPKMVEESGCYKNFIDIDQKIYSDQLLSFMDEDARITDYSHVSYVWGEPKIKNYKGTGNDVVYNMSFISESSERELENYQVVTNLSNEQLMTVEHPIYLVKSEKDNLSVNEGDSLNVIIDNKDFNFTVAGFYESGLWTNGAKMVVSEEDFEMLEKYGDRYENIGFNVTEGVDTDEVIKEFTDFVKEVSINDTSNAVLGYPYESLVLNYESNMKLLGQIIMIMAGVIIIAVIVMIRFRIVTDISEQIVSIGVLEAMGYKSRDIALSYIFEYVLVAFAGCILAFIPSVCMADFLLKNAASSVYYSGKVDVSFLMIIFIMVGLHIFIGLVALMKALSINKYPPVLAIRKGIATHHFKRTFLPLDKTKRNVHIRLAIKDYLENMDKKNGFIVCMTVTTIMFLISSFCTIFFSDADKVLKSVSGHELADINLVAVGGTDSEHFAEELRSMTGVEKVLLSSSSISTRVNDGEGFFMVDIYEDFSETETIIVTQGRLPEHDNEIAITSQGRLNNLKMGETVSVEYANVKRYYIVCGVVNSLVNANSIYMTEDGFKNLDPLYTPDTYKIFLSKDTDKELFAQDLKDRYGKEIKEIKNGEMKGDTLEEKLRNAAEIKMAKAMSESGVSYMEYAIKVGDKVITGSTSNMKITSLNYEYDFYENIMNNMVLQSIKIVVVALMVISVIVVLIVLSILMSSAIKNQHKELGIMKGLGYTARELKFQMSFKIIPPTVIGVILGSFISILIIKLLEMFIVKITISALSIVLVDLGILLFCFLCSYLNAKKIGEISVYELMTE